MEFEMSQKKALIRFTSIAEQAKAQCDKFAESFAKDPTYALSWANDVFKNAARLKVAQKLVNAFTEREGDTVCTIEQARESCLQHVMNKARYPAQSTDPTANLMEQFEAAAYAEALDEMEYFK
jgi:hypothetical protein